MNKMDRTIFKNNMLMALDELKKYYGIETESDQFEFEIMPDFSERNKMSSSDLYYFPPGTDHVWNGKIFSIDKVCDRLCGIRSTVPLWINVVPKSASKDEHLIDLHVSMRFRKPSQLHNKETGHMPFKVIKQ